MSTTYSYFASGLVLLLLLLPLVLHGWQPNAQLAADRKAAWAAARLRLLVATSIALALFALWWHIHRESAQYAWLLCFVLWHRYALPVYHLGHPEFDAPAADVTRAASLRPRVLAPALAARLTRYRVVAWALWTLVLGLSVLGLALRDGWADAWLLSFALAGAGWLLFEPTIQRAFLDEPEPLPPAPSQRLLDAYAQFRVFKVSGWFALCASAAVCFVMPTLLLCWYGNAALTWAIVIGAGGGCAIGMAGGVVGWLADRRRSEIAKLRLLSVSPTLAAG